MGGAELNLAVITQAAEFKSDEDAVEMCRKELRHKGRDDKNRGQSGKGC
jgi:hypothetical protein